MGSMRDVAALAGVSLGTVSKFFNTPHRVAPDTAARIDRAVMDLGFVRNEAARQLKSGQSRTLAFVALELNNPFFGGVADAMERRAAEANLFMPIVSSRGDVAREARYIEQFVQQRVFGVILASGLTSDRDLDLLHSRKIPTVLMDAWAPTDRFSSTSIDDYLGARLAVEHLIEQGSTRIAVVGSHPGIYQISERVRGAEAAVAAHGGVHLELLPAEERSVLAGRHIGLKLLDRRPPERPEGIFAINDSLALGVLEAVLGRIDVPGELRLIGYDDIDFAESAAVPLSSVRRPRESFGRSAVELILDQAAAEDAAELRHIVIEPILIPRASSRRH